MKTSDEQNLDKSASHNEGHMKRALEKLRHPKRWKVVDSADALAKAHGMKNKIGDAQGPEASDCPPPPVDLAHGTTSEYAATVGYTMAEEIARYLQSEHGHDALRKVFLNQATVVPDQGRLLLLSAELEEAFYKAGLGIVRGSSETIERTLSANWQRVPKAVAVSGLLLSGVIGIFFVLGLALALWRFALFGLL